VLGATAVAASASEMASWSAWPLLTVKTREAAKALPMIRHSCGHKNISMFLKKKKKKN